MSPADYRAQYEAGESIESLSLEAKCSRQAMRQLLVHAGVTIRPGVGAYGIHHQLHTPTVRGTGKSELEPSARIVRPSVSRGYR